MLRVKNNSIIKKMKKSLLFAFFTLGISLSQGATLIAHYGLGEADGLNNSVSGGTGGNFTPNNVTTTSSDPSTLSPDSASSLELTTRSGVYSGLYGPNFSSLGTNWAMQFDLKTKGTASSFQSVLKIGSDTNGLQLIYGNGASDQGSGLGFCVANNGGYVNRVMSTVNLTANTWNKISIVCLNGNLHLFLGNTDITDTLTKTAGNGLNGINYSADTLKLGYNNALSGNQSDFGVKNGTAYDEFKVWSIANGDSLDSVMSAMNIPEPATASLGLLALAPLLLRRRRA